MPAGRPTKYKKDFPKKLYEAMEKGKSFRWFLGKIAKVCEETGYRWVKEYPEFSKALREGKIAGEAWWEENVCEMMNDKNVNSPLVKLYLANRFGWSDKVDTRHSGTVQFEPVKFLVESTDDSEDDS